MEHPSRLSLVAATLAVLATLSACGGQDDTAAEDPGSSGSAGSATTATPGADGRDGGQGGGPATTPPTPAAEAAEADLAVEITGDEVSPNAAELEVGVGGSITVTVASDRAGELHVHSTPEQYVGFGAGDTSQELTFQTPGTVEVEDHDTGAVVAFVEVR